MSHSSYDFIVIGAGIAGASGGYALSERHRVLLLEQEFQPGYHATGRSAAFYTQAYGNAVIRALTTGGKGFFTSPPEGFCEHSLLHKRGTLYIGRADQLDALDKLHAEVRMLVPSIERRDADFALERVPGLAADHVAGCVWEPESQEIDVHALLQGYLKGVKTHGGSLMTDSQVTALERRDGRWCVQTTGGRYEATHIVNAAGAWADQIASMAGVPEIGLVPKRRTVCLFKPPAGLSVDSWPLVVDVDETFYFKPEAGNLLLSPADEKPSEPTDAQPEELDIATAVDRFEAATDLTVTRIEHKWAGLRSFVADRTPVVGFDDAAPGFFWLAGQGGYGIQTAPAIARCVSRLADDRQIPEDLAQLGVTAEALSSARLRAYQPRLTNRFSVPGEI